MECVLGLSLTPEAVRWVLVEGDEGYPVDHGTFDAEAMKHMGVGGLVDALLTDHAVTTSDVRAIGVTSAAGVEATAAAVVDALHARGLDDVVSVSDLEAVDTLACGIADVAGFDGVVVCVLDDAGGAAAVVDAGGITVERVAGFASPERFAEALSAVWAADVSQPDSVFVLGAAELEPVVAALAECTTVPVSSVPDAELALARGAALASAERVDTAERPERDDALGGWRALHPSPRVLGLASVLVAASVTFVVSVSVALGLQSDSGDDAVERPVADAARQQAPEPAPPARTTPTATAAPRSIAALTPNAEPPEPSSPALETVLAAAPLVPQAVPEVEPPAALPPLPEAPVEEPPAYVPPAAPVYVPEAPPAYVPPANTLPGPAGVPEAQQVQPPMVPAQPMEQPKPRLRDRIIDKIPLINRIGD